MNDFQNKLLSLIMGVLLLVSMLFVGREAARYVTGQNVEVGEGEPCVVIDAGHGEDDPRKL